MGLVLSLGLLDHQLLALLAALKVIKSTSAFRDRETTILCKAITNLALAMTLNYGRMVQIQLQ